MKAIDAICFLLALFILVQDYMGKEAWIAHIDKTWVDAKYSIPLALILIVSTIIRIYLRKKKNDQPH